jgi:hypothetical protein
MLDKEELNAAVAKAKATNNKSMLAHLDYHERHLKDITQGEEDMIRKYAKAGFSEFLGTILAKGR